MAMTKLQKTGLCLLISIFFWTELSICIQVEQEVLSCDFCQNEVLERSRFGFARYWCDCAEFSACGQEAKQQPRC